MIQCKKCFKYFEENEIELSHDIPKYMGGSDKYGRHYLCIKHHSEYDRMILARCFLIIFNQIIPYSEDRRTYLPSMSMIKKSNWVIQEKCKKIALQCKEEFYSKKGDKEDDNTNS